MVDEGSQQSLYHSTAVNEEGVHGTAYIDRKDGMSVVVSSPVSEQPGTNPEELLGLSLSTCFNSTIRAILKGQEKTNKSKVSVPVHLKKDPTGEGYYFDVEIRAAIERMFQKEAEEITSAASK